MANRGGTWPVEGPLSCVWKDRKGGKEAEAEQEAIAGCMRRCQSKEIENWGWRKVEEATKKGLGCGLGEEARRKRKMNKKRTMGVGYIAVVSWACFYCW